MLFANLKMQNLETKSNLNNRMKKLYIDTDRHMDNVFRPEEI